MTETPSAPSLTFRLLGDERAFVELAPAWEALLRDSGRDEPMRAPAWLLTWWRVYGAGRQLRVGLFRDGDRLVGLMPLCARRFWHRPRLPFRRLEYIGADGDETDGVCSEYLGPICAAGYEARVANAFAHTVAAGGFGPWDEVVLDAMDGSEALPTTLNEAFVALGYRAALETIAEAPYLPLPGSWDEYLAALDKHRRRHMREASRNFEQWAEGAWQLERVTSEEDLPHGLAVLRHLHNRRWHEADGPHGAFAQPRFVAFHEAYARQLLHAGGLNLCWLAVRGQPVAAQYEIVANGKVYFYQCGRIVEGVPARVSLGTALLILTVREAIARGRREYDFLAGQSLYKRKFTSLARPLVQMRVARNVPLEWLRRAARAGITAWRSARSSPAALPSGKGDVKES